MKKLHKLNWAFWCFLFSSTLLSNAQFNSQTGITCNSSCDLRVGHVSFSQSGAGRSDLTDASVLKDGAATETFSLINNVLSYQATGTDLNTPGAYAIVDNPSTEFSDGVSTGGNTNGLVNDNTGGVLLVKPKDKTSIFGLYTIKGLEKNGNYCVRIKLRNAGNLPVGQTCNSGQGIKMELKVMALREDRTPPYQDVSGGFTPVAGKFKTVDAVSGQCAVLNQSGAWNGNTMIDGFKYGATNVFEINVKINGNNQHPNADGFCIGFKTVDYNDWDVLAIEEIEVYGCLPNDLTAASVSSPNNTGTEFCEATEVVLKATNIASRGTEVKWFKDNVQIASGIDLNEITEIMPLGEGQTVTYKATGDYLPAGKSITLKSKLCCNNIGTSAVVLEEHFDNLTYRQCTDNSSVTRDRFAPIGSIGDISYQYVGDGAHPCGNVEDGQYAVVKTSHDGGYWGGNWHDGTLKTEVKEHTGTPNSGALLVNAGNPSTTQYFFKFDLPGLCPETTYEFSAWYASISMQSEIKPKISFEIYDGTTLIKSYDTGEVPSDFSWKQTKITFTTPQSGTIPTYTLQLKNLASSGGGNDLMIDDIMVTKCTPKVDLYATGTKDTMVTICSSNPIAIEATAPYGVQYLITGDPNGVVYCQWYEASSINGPWTNLGVASKNIFELDALPPTYVNTTKYYKAKLSVDSVRASDLNLPIATQCGNDAISSTFRISKKSDFDVNITELNISACIDDDFTLHGTTTLSGANYEWGWKRGASYPQSAFISGYALSSDENVKTYTKTNAQENDTDNYYFVVKKKNEDCEAYKEVAVAIRDCSTSDLKLTKTANIAQNDNVCLNEEITFTLTIENSGVAAQNVQVTDILPAELQFISSNGNYSNDVWNAGDMGAGSTKTLEMKVRAITESSNVVNTAYISNVDNTPHAYVPGNNYSSEFTITEIQKPVTLTLDASKTNVISGEEITLTATADPSNRNVQYEWVPGELTADNQYDLQIFDNKLVEVKAHDGVCDPVSASVQITVNWPNAILAGSPDDVNGKFLAGMNYDFKLYVFNRHGILVYEGSDGWNGTYDNKSVEPGTYFYVLEFEDGETRKATIEVVQE